MLKKFAKIEPNDLSIRIPKENDHNIPYNLTIENLTNKYLIIKFLINTKKILLVNPPTSFILPSKNTTFELILKTNDLPLEEYKKTKLLIIIIPSEEEIKTNEQAKNMYQNLKKQEIDKQEILYNLNWTMEETINTDINNNNNNNDNIKENNIKEEKIIFENYANKKVQLNSKYEEILKNIEENKKKLEKMMEQTSQENIKDKIKNQYNFDNLIMICLILLGLVFGANFAIGYNKLFNK